MNAKSVAITVFYSICILAAIGAPDRAFCERWVEFHSEKWNFRSAKLNKKLKFRNVYYYDIENLARDKHGNVTLWIKELADNDRYYVGKGVPAQETLYKNIRIRCSLKKYEILLEDDLGAEYSDTMSEDIKPDSCYYKLLPIVCKPGK